MNSERVKVEEVVTQLLCDSGGYTLWSDCHVMAMLQGLSVLSSAGNLHSSSAVVVISPCQVGWRDGGRVVRVVTWWGGRAHCPAGEMTLMNGAQMDFYLALFESAFMNIL